MWTESDIDTPTATKLNEFSTQLKAAPMYYDMPCSVYVTLYVTL